VRARGTAGRRTARAWLAPPAWQAGALGGRSVKRGRAGGAPRGAWRTLSPHTKVLFRCLWATFPGRRVRCAVAWGAAPRGRGAEHGEAGRVNEV